MNIPDKIIISGMEYPIKMVDDPLITTDNQRAYGHIDFENTEILIDKTLRNNQGHIQTLIHEIIHGIVYDREIDFALDDEEAIVNQLAKGLYQIIKDNPSISTKELNDNIAINIPSNADINRIAKKLAMIIQRESMNI